MSLPEFLIPGLLTTLWVFLGAGLVAIAAGGLAGLARRSRDPIVRGAASLYVHAFRGTSLLVQLFWFAFALPRLGLRLPNEVIAIAIPGLNIGAYAAEVVRGALQSVPQGQVAAAAALGLTPYQRMTRVLWPQAYVAMLPTLGNLAVELLKATALVSTIFITDLTRQAMFWRDHTGQLLPALGLILVLYFLLSSLTLVGVRHLETRARRGWRETAGP